MPSFSAAFRKGRSLPVSRFAVWIGVSDHLDSTRNTWDFLNRVGKVPHLLWNPKSGEVILGISLERQAHLVSTTGIQIGVICEPEKPFTDTPLEGSEIVCETMTNQGIPDVWPYGPPTLYGVYRGIQNPSEPGNYSANQINPEWTGIGPIDVRKIHGTHAR